MYFLLAQVTRIFDGRKGEGAMAYIGPSLNPPLLVSK